MPQFLLPDIAHKLFLFISSEVEFQRVYNLRSSSNVSEKRWLNSEDCERLVHPVNGEVPPVKGRPWKLPHYVNRGKTTSSGGEMASARSCFSTVRTALGKLRITGLPAPFDVARSFPQFLRPLPLQPTVLTSKRRSRFGIRKAPNHVPPPHLPDDPKDFQPIRVLSECRPERLASILCYMPDSVEEYLICDSWNFFKRSSEVPWDLFNRLVENHSESMISCAHITIVHSIGA